MTRTLGDLGRRPLGRSGFTAPPFGFGGAHLGELYAPLADADARAAVEAAWMAGVRFFDTAPWYGHGLSEHRLGEVLRSKPREDFVLETKVGRVYRRPESPRTFDTAPWAGGLKFALRFDYSYDGVMRSYEQSLMRLGINAVDTLVIHDLDHGYHNAEAFAAHWRNLADGGMRALQELKAGGEVRAIGAGVNADAEMSARMAEGLDLDFLLVAMPYTLLDQSALDGGFDACMRRGIGVIIGAPFASGLLATGPTAGAKYDYADADAAVVAKAAAIAEVCAAHGVALPAAALRFVLAHPAVASVIPGAVSAEQARANAAHVLAEVPVDLWADLKDKNLLRADAPTPDAAALA